MEFQPVTTPPGSSPTRDPENSPIYPSTFINGTSISSRSPLLTTAQRFVQKGLFTTKHIIFGIQNTAEPILPVKDVPKNNDPDKGIKSLPQTFLTYFYFFPRKVSLMIFKCKLTVLNIKKTIFNFSVLYESFHIYIKFIKSTSFQILLLSSEVGKHLFKFLTDSNVWYNFTL